MQKQADEGGGGFLSSRNQSRQVTIPVVRLSGLVSGDRLFLSGALDLFILPSDGGGGYALICAAVSITAAFHSVSSCTEKKEKKKNHCFMCVCACMGARACETELGDMVQ